MALMSHASPSSSPLMGEVARRAAVRRSGCDGEAAQRILTAPPARTLSPRFAGTFPIKGKEGCFADNSLQGKGKS